MKKLYVAFSAFSLLAFTQISIADGNMASWVAKNKPKPIPMDEIEKTEQIQLLEEAEPISVQSTKIHETEMERNVVAAPNIQQLPRQQSNPNSRSGMPQPQTKPQVDNEKIRQETTARALEALMPKVVAVINSPSVPANHKKYAFQYIGQVSQILAAPNNFEVASVVQPYNYAVSCSTLAGATNTLVAAHQTLMQSPILSENFKIARTRGKFITFGQYLSNIKCDQ